MSWSSLSLVKPSPLLLICFLRNNHWEPLWFSPPDPKPWGLILNFVSICEKLQGNGTPLQYSCLENPTDGGAWKAAVHGVAKSRTRLSGFTFTFHFHALEKDMATHSTSCLENPRDRGAWWAAIYGVAQSRTWLKWLSSSSKTLQFVHSEIPLWP